MPPPLKVLEEIERDGLPSLVEVLCESGIDAEMSIYLTKNLSFTFRGRIGDGTTTVEFA